ncbi:hypothetical protein [Craterilacuibacter sp. RT1T]|uniref:hypothetical protein n=1 Tax=Craterilacuibacter sp. RT1T TaxID=2942211 RepID=UPI0020C0B424|nr:hypothetical protein [Craterilacuibacter sp. RT1T]MCL6262893.1 hypothetical protein [Craterilacuibacter sp. RT1T]
MSALLIISVLLGMSLWLAAWRESQDKNRRDARLLGVLGATSTLTAGIAYLG